MKKHRKFVALCMAALMVAAAITGCAMPSTSGNNNASETQAVSSSDNVVIPAAGSDEQVTIRVVDWSDAAVSQREAFDEKYMEMHPNITVERTQLTVDQFKNTIITLIKSGDGPDLFPIPTGMTLTSALNEGWYQPLNPYVTEEFEASFDPKSFAEGVTHIGDQWYTITEIMPTIQCLVFYNQDVLDAAGVDKIPETYSEFRDACKKITENGNGNVYGLIDGGKQVNRLEVLVRSLAALAGGKIAAITKVLTDDGRAPYDTDAMYTAMQLIKDLTDDGTIHPDTVNISAPEARELFAQGQAGFICQGMWCISSWGETYPDLNYGVMSLPRPDGITDTYVQDGELVPWIGLYKESKHPQEAADYLMALFSEEYGYQSGCVEQGAYVSVIPAINEKYMTNEVMKQYATLAEETSRIVPSIATRDEKSNDFYAEVKDIEPSLGPIVQGVISKSITDYQSYLTTYADSTTEEWKRTCETVGMDYDELEFPNWDPSKDYTDADYEALK